MPLPTCSVSCSGAKLEKNPEPCCLSHFRFMNTDSSRPLILAGNHTVFSCALRSALFIPSSPVCSPPAPRPLSTHAHGEDRRGQKGTSTGSCRHSHPRACVCGWFLLMLNLSLPLLTSGPWAPSLHLLRAFTSELPFFLLLRQVFHLK